MESQDAVATFFWKLWPKIEANQNKIIGGAAIVVAVALIYFFFSWRHEQNQIEAGEAMTQTLLTLPTGADAATIASALLSVSTEYPNTPAGERSLIEAGAALFTEGKYTDAQDYFQQYMDGHPDGEFIGQAALGVAKSLEAQGKANQATGAYQHVINDVPNAETVEEARFALARLEMEGKNYADAVRLFEDAAQQDPYGQLGTEAAQYAFELRSKVPAQSVVTTPQTTTSPVPAAPININQ